MYDHIYIYIFCIIMFQYIYIYIYIYIMYYFYNIYIYMNCFNGAVLAHICSCCNVRVICAYNFLHNQCYVYIYICI